MRKEFVGGAPGGKQGATQATMGKTIQDVLERTIAVRHEGHTKKKVDYGFHLLPLGRSRMMAL